MNLDGYVRVSRVRGRDKDGDRFISPRLQRDRAAKYADLHGHKITRWHEDLDEPGSKAARPGFQLALERVEKGESDGIIVAKLDRFARSVSDAATAIKRIQAVGGQLVSVEDNFDTTTPMGRFAVTMILAVAELELERIRENYDAAREDAVGRGIHIASRAPTGYQRGADGRLQLDEAAAPVVAEVFRRRIVGSSLSELARVLEDAGVVGPYRNSHWTAAAVLKLLHNPAYTGQARSGEFKKEGAHAAIITPAEWRAAQGVRAVSPLRSGDGALLAGLLRCAGCRYVIKIDKMTDRDGQRIRLYRCRGDHAAGRCPAPASSLGRVIEPYVVELFFEALGPGGILMTPVLDAKDLAAAQETLSEAERELEAWIEDMSIAALGRDAYITGFEARQQRVADAQAAVDELSVGGPELPPVEQLRELWPRMTVAQQRKVLAGSIDAIVLRRGRNVPIEERTVILWRGQAPADLPSRGRRVPLKSFDWTHDRPHGAGVNLA